MSRSVKLHPAKYACIFVAIGLCLLFFYPVLFQDNTFFFRDIHRWFYPMKYFLAQSFKAGQIPFWCPHYFCGSPFMSDIQSGVFYPLSLILAVFPFPVGLNIYVVVHFFLGFCFFYLFITSLGLSRKAALITAISYCYGGYIIATLNTLNNLSTAIWLPAILWSFTRATKHRNTSRYFLTIVFLAMAILGGEPQLFILTAGLLLFYSFFLLPHIADDRKKRLKYSGCVILLILFAVLITMVQLGPTYIDYRHSARLGGLTYEETSKFSVSMGMLAHFWLPLYFPEGFITNTSTLINFFPNRGELPWLLTVYPGMVIAPLALIGVLFSHSRKTLFWVIVFFVTLLLALGHHTPLHRLFYHIFPFFRFPAKFIFLTGFSMLVMAAYGADRLFSFLEVRGTRTMWVFLALTLALILDLYVNHIHLNPLCRNAFYEHHVPELRPVLEDKGTFRIFSDELPSLPASRRTILNQHIKWQTMLLPDVGLLFDLDHVSGVPALELIHQYQIMELLEKPWEEKIKFLQLANVKYILSEKCLEKHPGLKGKIKKLNRFLYEILDPLPRAWLVGRLHHSDRGSIRDLINPSFNPLTSAIFIGKEQKSYHKPFFEKVEALRYESDNTIHIEASLDKPAVLVVSESYYPGWSVSIDGKETKPLRLDILFQGVEIPKGSHNIKFIFRPKHFGLFLCISLTTLSLLFLAWILFKMDHINNSQTPEKATAVNSSP